jgi:hypothetical protein
VLYDNGAPAAVLCAVVCVMCIFDQRLQGTCKGAGQASEAAQMAAAMAAKMQTGERGVKHFCCEGRSSCGDYKAREMPISADFAPYWCVMLAERQQRCSVLWLRVV